MKRVAFSICAALLIFSRVKNARADDAHYVVPTALLQTDWQNHPQDEEGFNGFSIERLRLGVWSQPSDQIFALAQAEFANPESPALLDAYARFGPFHGLRISVGYFKSPLFESARNELDGMMPMPELSLVTKALWPGRDTGIELHEAPQHFPLEIWLRASNGNNSPFQNDNNSYALTARVDATAGRGRIDASANENFGLRVGVGGEFDDSYDRAGVTATTAGDFVLYRPPTVSGNRRIVEAHVLAYFGPVRALVEAGESSEDRAVDADGNPSTPHVEEDPELSRGASAEVAWMITGEHRLPSVWPLSRKQSPFSFDHPAIELSARVDHVDVGRGMRDVQPNGATGGSIAANVWLNSMFAATLAGYIYNYERGPIEETSRTESYLLQARLTMYLNPPPVNR